jgi:16S rRNA (uracil1498-N3)-methyltransferase
MLPLFFVPTINSSNTLEAFGDEAHHAIKVVRLSIGDELQISDGAAHWAHARIIEIKKNSFIVEIIERFHKAAKSPELVVVQALMKSDRAKEAIELLTVAGVDRIIPWQSERSIAKWKNDLGEKWSTTARSAAKQARRPILPVIDTLQSTSAIAEMSARYSAGVELIVLHEEGEFPLSSLGQKLQASTSAAVAMIIGPEGGLTPNEIANFQSQGATVVRMGESVLRSAHAGFAALAAVQTLMARW